MGGRGRLGGLTGRRDRASDRRRELADLTYDGSAPSRKRLRLAPGTSASLSLPFSNGLDPRRSKSRRVYAEGRCAHTHTRYRWRSEHRGSKRPRIGRDRKQTNVLSEFTRGPAHPLLTTRTRDGSPPSRRRRVVNEHSSQGTACTLCTVLFNLLRFYLSISFVKSIVSRSGTLRHTNSVRLIGYINAAK